MFVALLHGADEHQHKLVPQAIRQSGVSGLVVQDWNRVVARWKIYRPNTRGPCSGSHNAGKQ